jgi:hypothetical protein
LARLHLRQRGGDDGCGGENPRVKRYFHGTLLVDAT